MHSLVKTIEDFPTASASESTDFSTPERASSTPIKTKPSSSTPPRHPNLGRSVSAVPAALEEKMEFTDSDSDGSGSDTDTGSLSEGGSRMRSHSSDARNSAVQERTREVSRQRDLAIATMEKRGSIKGVFSPTMPIPEKLSAAISEQRRQSEEKPVFKGDKRSKIHLALVIASSEPDDWKSTATKMDSVIAVMCCNALRMLALPMT